MSIIVAVGSGLFFWLISTQLEPDRPRSDRYDKRWLLIFIGMMLAGMHRDHPEEWRFATDAIGVFLVLLGVVVLWKKDKSSIVVTSQGL